MSEPLIVKLEIDDGLIRQLRITKMTDNETGAGTYHWTYTDHTQGALASILSAKDGTVEHVRENGVMVLLSKVAAAAAETET